MATRRWVVVDSLDSAIAYEGPWFTATESFGNLGNFGPTYLGTLHGIRDGPGSLTFPFNGSAIRLLGTNNPRNDSGVIDPQWDCLIDGVSVGPTEHFPYAENNWVFCSWDSNEPGRPHVLTVNVRTRGQTFWVDALRYVPSPSSDSRRPVVMVLHSDNVVKYDTAWTTLGSTANMTTRQGGSATVEFLGTRLSWWGFIPVELPHAAATGSYTIDNNTIMTFNLPGITTESPTIYNQMFFQTPELEYGPHRLRVTYQGDGQKTPLTLSHLLIHQGNITAPLSNEPSIFDVKNDNNTPNNPTTSDAPSASDSESNGPVIGAIVGGVLGGFALVILIGLAIYFFRRRSKKRDATAPPQAPLPPATFVHSNPSITPFQIYQHQNQHHPGPYPNVQFTPTHRSMPSTGTDQLTYDPPTTTGRSQSPSFSPQRFVKGHVVPAQYPSLSDSHAHLAVNRARSPTETGTITTATGSSMSGSGSGSGSKQIHHQDSGIRFASPVGEAIVEVPPNYTPN